MEIKLSQDYSILDPNGVMYNVEVSNLYRSQYYKSEHDLTMHIINSDKDRGVIHVNGFWRSAFNSIVGVMGNFSTCLFGKTAVKLWNNSAKRIEYCKDLEYHFNELLYDSIVHGYVTYLGGRINYNIGMRYPEYVMVSGFIFKVCSVSITSFHVKYKLVDSVQIEL